MVFLPIVPSNPFIQYKMHQITNLFCYDEELRLLISVVNYFPMKILIRKCLKVHQINIKTSAFYTDFNLGCVVNINYLVHFTIETSGFEVYGNISLTVFGMTIKRRLLGLKNEAFQAFTTFVRLKGPFTSLLYSFSSTYKFADAIRSIRYHPKCTLSRGIPTLWKRFAFESLVLWATCRSSVFHPLPSNECKQNRTAIMQNYSAHHCVYSCIVQCQGTYKRLKGIKAFRPLITRSFSFKEPFDLPTEKLWAMLQNKDPFPPHLLPQMHKILQNDS